MKRTAIIATLLTFLSFLLVLAAAVVFLLQGRQALRSEMATVSADRERLGDALWAAESTVLAQEAAVATLSAEATAGAVAQATTLAEQAAGAEATRADLESALATAEALPPGGPMVVVAAPVPMEPLPSDRPVTVLVAASDPTGVAALNVTVDGEALLSLSPADEPLVTGQTNWQPPGPGEFVLSAMAINARGVASQPVTITLTVVESGAAAIAGIRARVEANVVMLRGLTPLAPITPTLLSGVELRARIEENLAEYTPEKARDDARVLSVFDFLSPDTDLRAIFTQAYGEQIAGFYDTETGEFVVISDDDVLDPSEQWIHAHEFVHALQDQHYVLEQVEDESLDSEAQIALRALAEGDATLVQLLYLEGDYFTATERAAVERYLRESATAETVPLPAIVEQSLAFTYEAGFAFVLELYREGGYPAIDAAWRNPPRSTEQILHPERYRAQDWPQIVTLPPLTSTLGTGWRQLDEDILGEFYLREYLAQQVDRGRAEEAAAGWGGDRYAVYWRESDGAAAMVLRARWDTPGDAVTFSGTYFLYAGRLTGATPVSVDGLACWSAADVICFIHDGLETVVLRAPDLATAQLLIDALALGAADA